MRLCAEQTMSEMASEHTTTFFPLPIDLLSAFLKAGKSESSEPTPAVAATAPRPSLPAVEPHATPQIGAGEPLSSRWEPHAGETDGR